MLEPEKKALPHGSAAEALRAHTAGRKPLVPDHLKHLIMTKLPRETCPWSLSGPQFPQPTAIQQRYCYPKGDPEYAGRKGGALWTMYGAHGKEDFQFRLLHVYFSVKRAVNTGVDLSLEEQVPQTFPNTVASSSSVSGSAGTSKRNSKRISRATRSPWQERPKSSAPNGRSTKRLRRPSLPATAINYESQIPPPSPFNNARRYMESIDGSVYVSPNTAASSVGERHQGLAHGLGPSYMFDHRPFHPVTSFDAEESHTSGYDFSRKNQYPFRTMVDHQPSSGHQRHHHSPASLIEKDESFEFNEAAATVIGGTLPAWNDPLLALDGKPSFEPEIPKRHASGLGEKPSTPERLKIRLGQIHEGIREGILAHPRANQGALLSIVATWGRNLAQNPLVPTIRVTDPPSRIQIGKPPKVEQENSVAV